ncbi:MAG: hypothetical protein WCV00_21400 [Verrucomicrobiia bacterium]
MRAPAAITYATIAAHLVGSAVLFGILSGLTAVFFAPILSVFGWFFLVPEALAATVQWFVYRPSGRKWRIGFLLVSAIIAAPLVALVGPKEVGSEKQWALAYAFAAGCAAIASGLIIQFAKTPKPTSPRDA